jgi:hypothetical protein
MASQLSLTYLDYSNEKAPFSINIPTVTAANFAATVTLINALVAAIDDVTLGILNKRIMTIPSPADSSFPTDAEAQREDKWLVGYTDVTASLGGGVDNPYYGRNFTTEIATAELTAHLSVNSDYADLAEADVAAFVTAFEAFARSPTGGAVAINYVKFVGRST